MHHKPTSRPVLARHCPIGRASTKQGALRLGYRFANQCERHLFDAGWKLVCRQIGAHFHLTLAR